MLADEFPDIGHTAPTSDIGVHVTLHLGVEDVDSVIERAVAAGARLERPAADYEYGRNGGIRDPFGHRWIISAEPSTEPSSEPVTPALRHGDIGYVSLWVPDVERAARFFSSVLGWSYARRVDLRVAGSKAFRCITGFGENRSDRPCSAASLWRTSKPRSPG